MSTNAFEYRGVPVELGTITVAVASGTIGVGTIAQSAGTINAGTINSGTITAGTIDVMKAGTIDVMKAGTVSLLVAGTLDALKSGTITAGTIDLVVAGTLDAFKSGTITAGTINAGTITAGTIDVMKAGTVDTMKAGTVDLVKAGTLDIIKMGTVAVSAGTVTFADDDNCVITYEHEKIHDGLMWGASYYWGTLIAGGTALVSYMPGTTPAHVVFEAYCGADAELQIVRNPTLTGGTLIAVHNRLVDTAGSSLMSAMQGGTIAGGTLLLDRFLPGGSGKNPGGGGARGAYEWILSSGTITLSVIAGAAAGGVSINAEWYEEA